MHVEMIVSFVPVRPRTARATKVLYQIYVMSPRSRVMVGLTLTFDSSKKTSMNVLKIFASFLSNPAGILESWSVIFSLFMMRPRLQQPPCSSITEDTSGMSPSSTDRYSTSSADNCSSYVSTIFLPASGRSECTDWLE